MIFLENFGSWLETLWSARHRDKCEGLERQGLSMYPIAWTQSLSLLADILLLSIDDSE